jgi:tRNA pseudouridine32 synthase/23S rRNA pseudouridine746 synthase
VADDYAKPVQLLARSLRFEDPLTGAVRFFESGLYLSG